MDFKILREFPSPAIEQAWREYLTRLECPAHYDSPEFFREPLWAERNPFAILAFNGAKVIGVVTGLQPDRKIMCGLPSRPQVSVDPSANIDETSAALAEGLLTFSRSADLLSVFTWNSLPLPAFAKRRFQRKQLAGSVVLDLTVGADALFKQFTKDRRRNIRYAEKNGVQISEATTAEDYAQAYAVYANWRERRGNDAKGRTLSFDAFQRTMSLKGNRILLLARASEKVIATNVFRYFPGGLFESAANNSLEEFIHLKPNDLLQWKGIEWACQQGLKRHSLGGCHEFLLRFGGTVVPIFRYRLDCTWLHRNDLQDAVQGLGRKLVNRMPPAVAKKVRKLTGKEKTPRS